MNVFFFLGIQLLSFLVMGVFLFEHRRLCRSREQMFQYLGDGKGKRRVRMQYVLIGLYVFTTLFITAFSGSIFFLQYS